MPESAESSYDSSRRAHLLLVQLLIAAVVSGCFVTFLATQLVPHWQQQHATTLETPRATATNDDGQSISEKQKRESMAQEMAKYPFNPLEPSLPPEHPCYNTSIRGKKYKSWTACPVCYLPMNEAIDSQPSTRRFQDLSAHESPLTNLTYVTSLEAGLINRKDSNLGGVNQIRNGEASVLPSLGEDEFLPYFSGQQSWGERAESFDVKDRMRVHCGFVGGGAPGSSNLFHVSPSDWQHMSSCDNIVVVSAVFGAADKIHLPGRTRGNNSSLPVCFVLFIDAATLQQLRLDVPVGYTSAKGKGSVAADVALDDSQEMRFDAWRLVLVRGFPEQQSRVAARIPKLLLHRLFPNAKFSLWLDGKLKLRRDPHQVLERFLWRGNFSFALPRHFERLNLFMEAKAVKRKRKSTKSAVNHQMTVYRSEGMKGFAWDKLPVISDVPDSSVILRAHTPLSNLLSCVWFNEVARFTPRDQLSFAYVRDKVMAGAPGWYVNMFLDCERLNFVKFIRHRKAPDLSLQHEMEQDEKCKSTPGFFSTSSGRGSECKALRPFRRTRRGRWKRRKRKRLRISVGKWVKSDQGSKPHTHSVL